MPSIEKLHLSMRQILLKCLCSRGNEERIVLAPNCKQRRLRFAEIFLKFRIELYIRGVVEKQVELNFFVAWALEQSRVQRVGLKRDTLGIGDAFGVLPARSTCCQNALPEYGPVFRCGCSPILPDWAPSISQAFFIRVAVLRDDGRDPVGMRHCQTETSGRTVIKDVDCVLIDLESLRERVDRERQSIKGVRIFSFRRHVGESETWQVRRDHAVLVGQARNELTKHKR